MDTDRKRFLELLAKVKQGCQEAANQLAKEYGHHVHRAVHSRLPGVLRPRFDSVDIEQQVWKSFFAEVKSLPELKDPKQLIVYLATMVSFKIADQGRQLSTQKRDAQREVRLDDANPLAGQHPISKDPTPSSVAVFHEELERLLRGQPPHVRKVVQLKLEGMSYVEIARVTGINERAVREIFYGLEERRRRGESG